MLVTFECRISFLVFICIISCVFGLKQYGTPSQTLYVAEDTKLSSRQFLINREDAESSHLERRKRDTSTSLPVALQKNISTWTTHLNDSHQQLMVHWVGEGSNVIICLARDSTPKNKATAQPSALFISYDYGKNFTNKTENFKLTDEPNSGYAQLDKFFNHPKYPEFCVFVDSTNKKLYYTSDNGRNIHRSDLTFHPSDLAFDEEHPEKFVVLDKVNSNRTLHLTLDGGKTFKYIQSYVKTFFWSSGPDFAKVFYVERWKADGTSTVFAATDPVDLEDAHKLFEDAKDFQIKGDFMFATKQSKERNTLDLYISHQRGPFYKAEFQTELDLRKFHIADVTDKRIFVSVLHRENLADLYVSEISKNFTQYYFVLSMEQILCYFPDGNWKDSWLEDVTEDPFTDLYRVEGLKGIYIASRVDSRAPVANIGPEHLISLITFDHGVTWSPINPPTEDENGKPFNCHIENSCSLHLCQKFSQLYPVTRSASIMSSKSAPGIIMATGVMGKSLKGIPGVYVSRDAGLTWRRVLKDYYFFNYGDHGGVLVAVKYFKVRGETRHILYSTDEGLHWNSYQFNADDLRIYGLMTEPGENTTTFTMFGSANDQHQWIIITIDLQNAFARNCTLDDYKFWSPSPPNTSISCVLGSRDTFQRRLAHINCYNGKAFDRPIKKQNCECSRRDYECDFGFMLSGNQCIRNRTDKYDPYAIPSDCLPGHFYVRTKGYRKIDGDRCVSTGYIAYEPDLIPCPLEEPQEFILVALRDKIARIDLADNTSVIPVKDQKNIVAIEFDIKNNCIYWADIEVDKISRQCFNDGTSQEVVVDTDLASIEGMALDYISNVLFFVDGMRKKIEAVRTDLTSQGRMRVTILDNKVLFKPRGIAVHPRAGYLFWTDWDRNNPSVSRSNLDGTNVKRLFSKPRVQWPNGVTIDQMSEKVYWVDAMEDYIACADLDGQYFRKILWNDEKVSHPFAVAVLKDKMFWDDWKAKSIFIADKDTGANVITINDSFSGLMDLKVFAHFVQHGSNACSYKTTNCDALCLGAPGNGFSCLCPDGFTRINNKCMCHNGLPPAANMTCPKKNGGSCDEGQFTCKNGMCITSTWRCDGNNDCGDLSDEVGCQCTPPMIPCDNTRCYLPHWRCDGEFDCADRTDEQDCGHPNCTEDQFQCANGRQCIDKKWVCDGDHDCKDGSDERNCSLLIPGRRPDAANCSASGFSCGDDHCIPASWVCDGEPDCPGGEDERPKRCANSTCAPYMFRCPSGKCIYKTWVCDGENDCSDDESSDEKNCTSIGQSKVLLRPTRPTTTKPVFNSSCLGWMFRCDNGNCMPYWWRCDSIDDCGDGSDERGCHTPFIPTTIPDVDISPPRCGRNQYTCSPGVCIPMSWVCDTAEDCDDGSDERACDGTGVVEKQGSCAPGDLPCGDGTCVKADRLCDGHSDCATGLDEVHCSSHKPTRKPVPCTSERFMCDDGLLCLPEVLVCNGFQNCYDGSDESNCSYNGGFSVHQPLITLGVDQSSINSTSFLVSCWMPQPRLLYRFLPAIANVTDGVWRNTTWTNDAVYRFTNLEPFTTYNVTFYIQNTKSNETYPSMKYVTATTAEGVPSPPTRITVRQMIGSRVNVVWDKPKQPRGVLRRYTLYYAPPLPPMQKIITAPDNNNSVSVFVEGFFKPNVNYSFWVTATNTEHTSNSSEVAYLAFDAVGDVDDLEIVNATVARGEEGVFLQWHEVRGVSGYIVRPRLPYNYVEIPDIRTNVTNVTIRDLPPGVTVVFEIMAYKDNVVGRVMTARVVMPGTPHETLSVTATLQDSGTAVKLEWNRPQGERYKGKDIEYVAVYKRHPFGVNKEIPNRLWRIGRDTSAAYPFFMEKMFPMQRRKYFNSTEIITRNTSVVIDNLEACEAYLFTAGIRGGPLAPIIDRITGLNPRAPVKNLRFNFKENKTQLEILWNANCEVVLEPLQYRLDITEETRGKTSRFLLLGTKNSSLSHVIKDIPVGGRFNVCLHASLEGAAVTCRRVSGLALSPPDGVVAWRAPNGHVVVNWRHDHHVDTPHKYEVLVSEKEIPDDLLHPDESVTRIEAETAPVLIRSPDTEKALYVAVRAVTPDGYYSDFSEVSTLNMEGIAEADTQSSSANIWAWVCGSLSVIALCCAVTHLVLRRSRLGARTPHTRYDSRRGQATITDHDDDDVPPIHGFSDDEPLVIA